MAHAEDVLKYTKDAEKRKRIEQYEDRCELMPKLLSYDISAIIVDNALKTDWTSTDGKFKTDLPVSCRIFNLTEAIGPSPRELHAMPDSERIAQFSKNYSIANKAVEDLKKIGVKAFVKVHKAFLDGRRDKFIDQSLICLPHIQLTGKGKDIMRKGDIEGAEVFLAYLLEKGWIAESEISKEVTSLHGKNEDAPFNGLLKGALSAETQNKIISLKKDVHSEQTSQSLSRY